MVHAIGLDHVLRVERPRQVEVAPEMNPLQRDERSGLDEVARAAVLRVVNAGCAGERLGEIAVDVGLVRLVARQRQIEVGKDVVEPQVDLGNTVVEGLRRRRRTEMPRRRRARRSHRDTDRLEDVGNLRRPLSGAQKQAAGIAFDIVLVSGDVDIAGAVGVEIQRFREVAQRRERFSVRSVRSHVA